MALEKRETLMNRLVAIAGTLTSDTFTVARRIGDPDPQTLDIAGFPYFFIKDDVLFVNTLVNMHEGTNLLAGISIVYDSVDLSPTKLNVAINEFREKVYTDSILGANSDFIKFDNEFKNRVPETNYTILQAQLSITYEERIF